MKNPFLFLILLQTHNILLCGYTTTTTYYTLLHCCPPPQPTPSILLKRNRTHNDFPLTDHTTHRRRRRHCNDITTVEVTNVQCRNDGIATRTVLTVHTITLNRTVQFGTETVTIFLQTFSLIVFFER